MLLIWDVTSAADAKNYYAGCLAAARTPDQLGYYSEGQESPGRYGGKLGEGLGLAGKVVDETTFNRLCDNRHPFADRPLTPRTNEFRRVCKDLTFSGPKSFSIVEAFAGEEERRELRRIFDEAVTETIAEDVEPDMQTRVRKGGADYDRPTGNALTAGFVHLTARVATDNRAGRRPANDNLIPDPHYHEHVLVWNATRDPVENRIKAGQVGDIVRDKGCHRAAFYARLAGKLEALGYVIDRRGGYEWEIAGVPQSVIDRFSKRTAQIEAAAEERGITAAAVKAALGAKTRGKKQNELTMPELRRAWDAQLTDGERDALAKVYRREIAAGQEMTAEEAVRYAIDHISEQLSVFPEREVKRVALLHGLGGVTPAMIDREMQQPRHGVIVQEIDGRRMATTQNLQAEEDEIIGSAARGKGMVTAVGVPEGLSRERPDGKILNDGQWAAVTGLLASENRYNAVTGPAGAGKTDLLKACEEGLALAGKRLDVLATTSDAVAVLHKDGFKDARTVAHFLLDERLQTALRNGHAAVDEASMLGHKDALRFFRLADQLNLKVTFVYDPMQHGSVPRGALPTLLGHAGIREFRLKQIMRQRGNPGYLAAVESLAEGRTLEGFNALDEQGYVREIADESERYRALGADYVQAAKDKVSCLVVSPTHAEAARSTDEIRSQLRSAGLLGKEDHAFTRLVAVNASEAERGQASTYRPGEVILFHQNAKGFRKGDRLIVADPAAVPLAEAGKFSLYRQDSIGVAVGEKLRFTGTVKTIDGHTLKNGTVKTVAAIAGNRLRLDNGWVIDGGTAVHFRHGYVHTSFGSQGKTVQRVLLGMSAASAAAMNQEQMYVSASRGKESLRLYTDDKAAVRAAIKHSSRKLAAVDLRRQKREPKGHPIRQHWERLKRYLDRRRRVAYFEGLRPSPGRTLHSGRLPLGGGQPTHAERIRHQRQELGHER